MSSLREAAQQVLSWLDEESWPGFDKWVQEGRSIRAALRAALAEQDEPVAWIHTDPDKPRVKFLEWREDEPGYRGRWIKTPLYAAPQRKPLTKDSLPYIYNHLPNWGMDMDSLPQGLERFARAIVRAAAEIGRKHEDQDQSFLHTASR